MCVYVKMVDRYVPFVLGRDVQSPSCHAAGFSASQEIPLILLPCLPRPGTCSYSEPT
jgi:hypothetical protein